MENYIPPDRKMINRLEVLIETNFRKQRDLNFYCDALGITLRRLNKVTEFYFNKTLYQLLQDRIHNEAVFLLSQTTMTAREICFELGVCDPAYFTRCFKQIEGVGPREFRKQKLELSIQHFQGQHTVHSPKCGS